MVIQIFMLDFAITMNNYARVKIKEFTNIDHRTNAHKQRWKLKGEITSAIEMIKRAVASGYICRLSACG